MKITHAQWQEIVNKRIAQVERARATYGLHVSDYIRDRYVYDMSGLTVTYGT